MKRRSFLQSTSAISLPFLLNGMPLSAFSKNALFNSINGDNDNVLVLIQLNGGNDGLNTIIPLDKYDILGNVRSNILIPENQLLNIDQSTAFHPNMEGIKSLYDNARMAIVQDVAYPNQNRSHFRSTDIWNTGSPADEFWTTGWVGRYFENRHPSYPDGYPNEDCPDPFAISIGSAVHENCQSSNVNFSIALRDPFSLAPLADGGSDIAPDTPYGKELDFLREIISQSNAYGDNVSDAAERGGNLSAMYEDDNALAQQLKIIALLMSGGLRTKIYIANIGGFDTHANQVLDGNPTTGEHAELISSLSNAVEAFQDDLALLGLEERVITMTFSEFGRRIRSNDSLGTDHGTAAPVMVFGTCLNPGIIGTSPELPDNPDIQTGVPMQFDFRNVFGSVMMDWFDVSESEIKQIFLDDFDYIPIINSCQSTSTIENQLEIFESKCFPNPCTNWLTIQFDTPGENIRINLFDAMGQKIRVITNRKFTEGKHEIRIDTSQLIASNYFYQIIGENRMRTKTFTKV
ncbi:MAG: DUF1501 domain-containing protein [Saprospiraceae bacterium]|nr:DUF1501 domain-containing protein [Saprospiraceae bacterium]